jgi:tRNA pseudouridine synthase 10
VYSHVVKEIGCPICFENVFWQYSRNISQSRWMIDDERMGEGSVQEVIGDVVFPPYKGDSYKFHAAGREDIDVRMLGPGRPFIVEISNARVIPSSAEIGKLERDINSLKEGWVSLLSSFLELPMLSMILLSLLVS